VNTESSQAIARWIESAFAPNEFLAIGGGFADGTIFHHGAAHEFSACLDDACWKAILETVKRLCSNDCDARSGSWVFENAILWVNTREDGTWLGVFTSRDLTDDDRAQLRQRLDAFVAL
jgi:hypothetical protein